MSHSISPLRQKPLRLPGQSLEDTSNALWDERGLFLFLYPIFLIMLAGVEWFRWFHPAPAAPWFTTIAVASSPATAGGGCTVFEGSWEHSGLAEMGNAP